MQANSSTRVAVQQPIDGIHVKFGGHGHLRIDEKPLAGYGLDYRVEIAEPAQPLVLNSAPGQSRF